MTTATTIRMIVVVVAVPLVLCFAPSGFSHARDSNTSTITSPRKRIAYTAETVVVEGRWERLQSGTSIPVTNSVEIKCVRQASRCDEIVAAVFETEVTKPVLMINTFRYDILSWSETEVKAVSRPRAADVMLRVSFNGEVERTATEVDSRGARGASPLAERWRLK